MTDPPDRTPWIALPPPVDRRARLGPFPSSREALKFVGIATLGAVIAGITLPEVWLPFLVGGFALAVVQSDGKALDERLGNLVSYYLRVRTGIGVPAAPRANGRGGVARLDNGRHVTVVKTGGIPVAFLPPHDLRRTFETYRTLLRSLAEGAYLCAGVEPMDARDFRPRRSREPGLGEAEARRGYEELVLLLCRRRQRRAVFVVLGSETSGPGAVGGLEDRTAALVAGLEGLGTTPKRLRGEELRHALRRLGWLTLEVPE